MQVSIHGDDWDLSAINRLPSPDSQVACTLAFLALTPSSGQDRFPSNSLRVELCSDGNRPASAVKGCITAWRMLNGYSTPLDWPPPRQNWPSMAWQRIGRGRSHAPRNSSIG